MIRLKRHRGGTPARPPVHPRGMFSRHPVGEGLAPPAVSRKWPWVAVGAAPCGRPPDFGRVSFHAEGFALRGEFLFPRRKRNQNAAGGELRWASPPIVAHPPSPFTGDTPIPLCNISGAQNMVPGLIPSGPLGPSTAQNFGLCYFTAAPGSDQPWQGVRNRRRVDRNCSEHRKRAGRCPAPAALKNHSKRDRKRNREEWSP